jgi:sugar lactone lactonase YvrE
MVVTGTGDCYISNTGGRRLPDGMVEPGGPASIALCRPSGDVTVVAKDLAVSNGMVVAADMGSLIVAETAGAALTRFRIDDDGTLSGREVFAPLPGLVPNGICLDADECVWVSSHTGEYVRVAAGGRIVERVPVPGARPGRRAVACMLGGADRRELYLCSVDDLSVADLVRGGLTTGRLDVVTVDVPGAGWP